MGILNFFISSKRKQDKTIVFAEEPMEVSIVKTNTISRLLKIPAAARDERWNELFYSSIADAGFCCGEPEMLTGDFGFQFFVLRNTDPAENQVTTSISNLKNKLLQKGLGILINPSDRAAEWIFSYGDIVELDLTGKINSTAYPKKIEHIDMTKKVQVLKSGDQLMLAQPSEKYLPAVVRKILKKFLQSKGISKPMIMLICRKQEGEMIQELAFNVHPEDFATVQECDELIYQVSWFLPRNYLIASFAKNTFHSGSFREL